jgi:hypothetical protein
VRTLSGHFDGEHIVLDEPADLKPNTRVSVLVPEHEEAATEIVQRRNQLWSTLDDSTAEEW